MFARIPIINIGLRKLQKPSWGIFLISMFNTFNEHDNCLHLTKKLSPLGDKYM